MSALDRLRRGLLRKPRPVTGQPGAMVIIISGPSGVGKDATLRALRERFPDPARRFVVTYKTRQPRAGEVAGVDYHFVSLDDFLRMQVHGELLEASEVHGHWSGTPRDQVAAALEQGCHAILKIDVQGADKVKALVPEALRIFLAPPSKQVQEERLARRRTETAAEMEQRNLDAAYELSRAADFDHVVINETDHVEDTARAVDQIIRQEQAAHPDRRITL
jgi:guanylate kinase